MIPSIRPGVDLPENFADFHFLAGRNKLQFSKCIECSNPFSDANVVSRAGWLETQISGMCENCFDTLFAEEEPEE